MVSEQAHLCRTAEALPSKSPSSMRSARSSLSTKSEISRSPRLATLSACARLSTAITSRSPRAFNAFTRFDPMNPAAPVTMSAMTIALASLRVGGEACRELLAVDHGGAELADDDPGRVVRDAHRRVQVRARRDHQREDADHRVARPAAIIFRTCTSPPLP